MMPMHIDHGHQSERAWRDEQRRAALELAAAAEAIAASAQLRWPSQEKRRLRAAIERVRRAHH